METLTLEERLERLEAILEKSGLGLLAQMGVGETLAENLGLLMEPKNLKLLSLLARYVEQAEALEKLAPFGASILAWASMGWYQASVTRSRPVSFARRRA
jgi:hypothetical protein